MDINLIKADYQEVQVESHTSIDKKINLRPVIRRMLYALAFVIPLFFLPLTSDFVDFNKQTLLFFVAAGGLILFLVEAIHNGAVSYRKSRLYLPMLAVLAVTLAASIFSKNVYRSFFGFGGDALSGSFITVLSLIVLFLLAINTIEDKGKRLRQLMLGSVSLALLFGLLQVVGLFVIRSTPFNSFYFNTVGSLNSLALLAALLMPWFLEEKLVVLKFLDLYKLAAVFGVFLMILLNWWLIWATLFVALICWLFFKTLHSKHIKPKNFLFPLLLIVVGVFAMLIRFSIPILKNHVSVEASPSYGSSLGIYEQTIKNQPLTGYGPGNFSLAYDLYKPSVVAQTIFSETSFNQSASTAFTFMVEGGLLATLAIIFLLVMIVLEVRSHVTVYSATALAFVAVFFFYPFNISLILFMFLALAVFDLQAREEHGALEFESSQKLSLVGSLTFVVVLVALLAGGYFMVTRYVADVYYAQAFKAKDNESAINKLVSGINVNGQDPKMYRVLSQVILSKLSTELNGQDSNIKPEDRAGLIQNLATSLVNASKKATDIDPYNSINWFSRGIVYQNLIGVVGGADQASISMYQESLKRNPADPESYTRSGDVYLTVAIGLQQLLKNPPQGQNPSDIRNMIISEFASAEANYKKAIALNDNYGQALYDLAVVYDQEGRLSEEVKQFVTLVHNNPIDPSLTFELGLLYYRNNQKDQAFSELQQAVALFPNYSNARWYLSLIYEERGDLDNALTQVQAIQKLNPDNQQVLDRIKQLQAGQRIIPPGKVLNQKPL